MHHFRHERINTEHHNHMMATKKRKRNSKETSDDSSTSKECCIIHFDDVPSRDFVTLTEDRLYKLIDIRKLRLAQPADSHYRMKDICAQIPETVSENVGYHRDCYKRFSANLHRLSPLANMTETCVSRPPRCPSDDSERYIFNPYCIFCQKSMRHDLTK